MGFTAVGSPIQGNAASFTMSPATMGDLILFEVVCVGTTVTATGMSGGGCTWIPLVSGTASANNGTVTVFAGTVTATGSSTATVSFSGATPTVRSIGQEFTSTTGSWYLDTSILLDSSGAASFSALTPAAAGELYFSFSRDSGSASAGSTSGYTYFVDGFGNGLDYNTNCTSAAQQPAWADSGHVDGMAVLLSSTSLGPRAHTASAALTVHPSFTATPTPGSGNGKYRLFPATGGPATASSYTGNLILGMNFSVTSGGNWFEGYWFWCCNNGQPTSPVKCALWSASPTGAGGSGNVVVPGSVVTSGPLVAGAWNWIPLPEPVQLAVGYDPNNTQNGGVYTAAIGANGSFPDTNPYFGNGGPAASGITSGPLFAFSASATAHAPPYGLSQGSSTTAGSDPSTAYPSTASSDADNYWVDVQISSRAPAAYTGSYRIWPSKFDANSASVVDLAVAYVVATEVDIAEPVTLNYAHYFLPNGSSSAAGLATSADVWDTATHQKVATIASPAWTTEAGGAVTIGTDGQWIKAAFPGGTVLQPGKYRVSVYNANGAAGGWNVKDSTTGYFVGGVGSNDITWGPLTAPSMANAQPAADYFNHSVTDGGQPAFDDSGSNDYPNFTTGSAPGQVYFVDLEATPVGGSSGLLMAGGII